jgi:anaerobic selenocysteine-containing dehydrogenase
VFSFTASQPRSEAEYLIYQKWAIWQRLTANSRLVVDSDVIFSLVDVRSVVVPDHVATSYDLPDVSSLEREGMGTIYDHRISPFYLQQKIIPQVTQANRLPHPSLDPRASVTLTAHA